jgi:hypothetical protein
LLAGEILLLGGYIFALQQSLEQSLLAFTFNRYKRFSHEFANQIGGLDVCHCALRDRLRHS